MRISDFLETGVTGRALGALSLLFLSIFNLRGIHPYDEGLTVYGAQRILIGEIPYRDFWTVYSPGQLYILAFLFKIFGSSLWLDRLYTSVAEWGTVVAAFFIVRRIAGSLWALGIAASLTFWWAYARPILYSTTPALLLALTGFLILRGVSVPAWKAALAGFLAGCAFLLRHDLAMYLLAAHTIVIAMTVTLQGGFSFRRTLTAWLPYSLAYAAVVLPVIIAFFALAGAKTLYEAFVYFPSHIYSKFRALPMPRPQPLTSLVWPSFIAWLKGIQDILDFYLPIVVFAASVTLLFRALRRTPIQDSLYPQLVGLAVFGLALEITARVRPDMQHMTAPMIVAMILFPWLSQTLQHSSRWSEIILRASLTVCFAVLVTGCVVFAAADYQGHLGFSAEKDRMVGLSLPRAHGITIPSLDAEGITETVRYIQSHTERNERIFIGNTRHDKIFINFAILYFLAERNAATRYNDLHPGVATTAAVQQEIIGELVRDCVRYVVLWDQPATQDVMPPDSKLLDEYISDLYHETAQFARFHIMVQNSKSVVAGSDLNK